MWCGKWTVMRQLCLCAGVACYRRFSPAQKWELDSAASLPNRGKLPAP